MPTYDYVCTVCSHEFEAFHGINENPVKECPECGSAVERKIGAGTGLLFRGSGFYITDYKKKKESTPTEKKSADKKEKPTKVSK
jgi:putative FmdB family regulatory protein